MSKALKKTKETDVDLKLFSAFRLLEQSNLLYFKVLKKLNFIIDKNFKYIGAVGFNQKNKQIYMILQEKAMITGSDEDIAGLLEHETGHVLYEHILKDKEQLEHIKDKGLLNQAQDYIINDSCHFIKSRLDLIEDPKEKSILNGGCFYKNIKKEIKELEKIDSDELTSIQLYNILKNNGFENDNQNFDSHDSFEIVEDSSGNESIEKVDVKNIPTTSKELSEIAKEIFSSVIDQLKKEGNLNKAIGQLSGQMQILVSDLIRSKTDKNSVFNFINRITYGVKKKWSKLHTRYPYIAKGKRKNKKPKIGLLIDTSGSMGTDELFGMIKFQIKALSNRCESFYILVGDTKLESSLFIKNKNSFNPDSINFVGGGGTNLQFGWDFAKDNNLDGLIIHTDGHIGSFDDHGIKSIFYLYGEGSQKQDGYQNIMVYPD